MKRFLRFNSTLGSLDVASLRTKIAAATIKPSEALRACAKLENDHIASSTAEALGQSEKSVEEARNVLQEALDKFKIDEPTLKAFFVAQPPPSATASILALQAYNKQNPQTALSETVSMIPFRRATYFCDFDVAFRILDLTSGRKSPHQAVAGRRIYKIVALWAAGMGAALFGLDKLLASGLVGDWTENRGMVLSMAATYLLAVSVYGTLARQNSKSGVGEVLRWSKGVLLTQRSQRARELKMASLMAEMNRSLPENHGECAVKMLQELQARDLETVESEDELLIKEYWARGGDGFEWVEPDQDPAWQIWRARMEKSKQQRIGSPYVRHDATPKQLDWAERVANNQDDPITIPHASLIDITKLSVEEKFAMLDQELKSLKENDRPAEIDKPRKDN
ncbi:hypothetical protein B9G98_01988 [Wickerhamiella sorbophila]|uniref:Uncharacterized protein n=1 Tax=Wickerhamiella sorbophila TaxID=45607 RepID=A0A2T0FH92_9ASCO|nr:hypothetical protein B9G98_01988 [Wickerhamiella sorbophila]PRT54368.1 hypothetical protein B9G98_01988 [Wickerhamiella sorbophila]